MQNESGVVLNGDGSIFMRFILYKNMFMFINNLSLTSTQHM